MKRKNKKGRGSGWHNDRYEHALAGMGYRPRAKGLVDKREKRKESSVSFDEYVRRTMMGQDISREEAERKAKKDYDRFLPEEGTVTYEIEKGDVLNFQSAFYGIKGKWKILSIGENKRGKEVITLGKLTKSGNVSKRTRPRKFRKSKIESSVSKWVEKEYNHKNKRHDTQRVEFVEED